ncbi:MAG: hypothetical protein PWQ66_1314 [Petrotoga sp.]|nr:hypothetical protein [Petrotoga sp.]
MGKGNLASLIYDKIKERILSLEYPPDCILQERSLALEFGASRTPLREAIHRLSQEGWLIVNSRKNIKVRPVSTSNVKEVFQARRFLEIRALELIFSDNNFYIQCRHQMGILFSVMRESKGTLFSFISLDQSFHSVLFQVLNNPKIMKFWGSVSEEMIWLGMLAMDECRYDDVVKEHEQIVEAFKVGNKRLAQDALLEHLEKTERILLKKIENLAFSNTVKG